MPNGEDSGIPGDARQGASLSSLIGLLVIGLSDSQLIAPILPVLAEDLGTGVSQVGASVTAYAVAAALGALVFGPRSDRFGRRRYLIGSGVVFALGSLVAATSSGFIPFVVARCLVGAAAGVISALVVAAIADLVPYERRGRAMSWVAVAYFAAPVLIVPVAAAATGRFGWRMNYWGLMLIAALGTLVLMTLFQEVRSTELSLDEEPGGAWSGYVNFCAQGQLLAGALSAFFVSGGFVGFTLYLGAYLRESLDLELESVALVFSACGAFGVIGAVGAGRMADHLGKKRVAIGSSLALAGLVAITPWVSGLLLYAVLALVGLAAVSRVAPLQSLITELVSPARRAAYVAFRNTLSQFGIGSAALVGAWLYPRGFAYICFVTASFSVVAAVLLLWIREPEPTSKEAP